MFTSNLREIIYVYVYGWIENKQCYQIHNHDSGIDTFAYRISKAIIAATKVNDHDMTDNLSYINMDVYLP